MRAKYLELYRAADKILRQPDNPCAFEVIDDVMTCQESRRGHVLPGVLCCEGCEHHDPAKGCTVQSLACKLGWCFTVRSSIEGMKVEDHPTFIAIHELKIQARQAKLPMRHRASLAQNGF